ncbi:hypothetical protein [Saccharothrix longispora]|uniref:hypothetical protein n=1 Tax=Saccharothrix longispora TaxID=33920 RepID=UPI0028FDB7A2|nr:hypothetical protein [Saccharothrix longispora]MDU0289872.1 hypothetical protein [Saccharothrix longispora]
MTDHPDVAQVHALAAELLDEARGHHSHRAARTLVTGTSLRATLIALTDGAELAEHDAPPAATLQVLSGRVELHTHDHRRALDAGDLAPIPPARHGLTALADSVVLLTVALR